MTSPFTTSTFNDVDGYALAAYYRDQRVEAEQRRVASLRLCEAALRANGDCHDEYTVQLARDALDALGLVP